MNILLLIVVAVLLNKSILEKIYRGFVGISATFSIFLLTYRLFLSGGEIRRLGGIQISGAVNNIGQMMGVAFVLAIAGLICTESWKKQRIELVSIPFLLPTLILTTSRAAIIGVMLSIMLVFIFMRISVYKILFSAISGLISTIMLVTTVFEWNGLYRFTFEYIVIGINNRIHDYQRGIFNAGFAPVTILFGGGMYRAWEIADQNVAAMTTRFFPHNVVIGMYVLVGFPAAILFGLILIKNVRSLFYMTFGPDMQREYVTLGTLLAMIVILMYSFTSGTVTRTFSLWFILGVSEYLFISRKGSEKPAAMGEVEENDQHGVSHLS
jgi:hypothetical protein